MGVERGGLGYGICLIAGSAAAGGHSVPLPIRTINSRRHMVAPQGSALLLYATGGVAYGRVEESVPGASVKVPGVGWAAGAGLQYAFTPQWSIGAEYLHVELDGPSANVGGISIDTKAKTDLGRATLNYKF